MLFLVYAHLVLDVVSSSEAKHVQRRLDGSNGKWVQVQVGNADGVVTQLRDFAPDDKPGGQIERTPNTQRSPARRISASALLGSSAAVERMTSSALQVGEAHKQPYRQNSDPELSGKRTSTNAVSVLPSKAKRSDPRNEILNIVCGILLGTACVAILVHRLGVLKEEAEAEAAYEASTHVAADASYEPMSRDRSSPHGVVAPRQRSEPSSSAQTPPANTDHSSSSGVALNSNQEHCDAKVRGSGDWKNEKLFQQAIGNSD